MLFAQDNQHLIVKRYPQTQFDEYGCKLAILIMIKSKLSKMVDISIKRQNFKIRHNVITTSRVIKFIAN